jgi:uncharacterized peroxidase-related enzyme
MKGSRLASFAAVVPEKASERSRELLVNIESRLGMVPNFLRAMAVSPVALAGYHSLSCALDSGVLSVRLREQVALTVSELNHSPYCLASHSAVGQTVGLNEDDIADSRRGQSPDSRVAAALRFVGAVVEKKGKVADEDVSRLFQAGYTEEEAVELVGNVVLTLFANYFNLLAGPALDFPEAAAVVES